jgi:hypothetical protein
MPPANNMAPFNHSRSPSLDSKQDYMPGAPFGYKSHAGSIRQSLDRYTESSDSGKNSNKNINKRKRWRRKGRGSINRNEFIHV